MVTTVTKKTSICPFRTDFVGIVIDILNKLSRQY